ADRLLVAAVDLAVGEGAEVGSPQIHVELARDASRELHGAAAAEDHQALGVVLRDRADHLGALLERCHQSSDSSSSVRAFRSAKPSTLSCFTRLIPSAPGGTSSVITEPAPV